MRAVVIREFGPPEVLEPAEVAEVTPGPDEAVIDVEFAGVTFVETQIRAGKPPHPSKYVTAVGLYEGSQPGVDLPFHARGYAGFVAISETSCR